MTKNEQTVYNCIADLRVKKTPATVSNITWHYPYRPKDMSVPDGIEWESQNKKRIIRALKSLKRCGLVSIKQIDGKTQYALCDARDIINRKLNAKR